MTPSVLCPTAVRRFFKKWNAWASCSKLKPVEKVAKMLKSHQDNLLTPHYPRDRGKDQ